VWRLYRDPPGRPPGHFCVEEGIAYPDDLPERDPGGYHTLIETARELPAEVAAGFGSGETEGGLVVRPMSWWLNARLHTYGYGHRDRCAVVGFNLLFDLGALACYWGPAEGSYRGGWSLGIWGSFNQAGGWKDARYRQRLLMKAIDPRRTLFAWGSRREEDAGAKGAEARFIDLRTLAFALTDRSYNLEGACAAFGDPYEKPEVDYELLTPELVEYAFEDVRHTALLYRHTLAELAAHEGIALDPHRLYSPATVGARYLEAMGVERPLEKFTELTDSQLGWERREPGPARVSPGGGIDEQLLGFAMSAFYGGRAEARIVRTPVPVVHVDFTSMYPAVGALLGTWPVLRAASLRAVEATNETRALLEAPDLLDRCLTRELWTQVAVTLVEIEPDGDILPVRATFDPESEDFGISVTPVTYAGRLWYALPDVIAAAVLGPRPPRVTRAVRIESQGVQRGLRAVRLRGGTELDPRGERDPFLAMIEERARVRADPSLSEVERDRLQLFLKITANATAYGSLARFDRRDLAEPVGVAVHAPDERAPRTRTATPEDPGPYCFPPVACSITAGARLMLAVLEGHVTRAGGTYAFADTDALAIVATPVGGQVPCKHAGGDHITALSWARVRDILDRFAPLNPYDPMLLEPWKVEHRSLEEQLYCYAISAKRYALYRQAPDGRPQILAARDATDAAADEPLSEDDALTDWSEHGLGMYLDPTTDNPDRPARDSQGRRVWIREVWERILHSLDGTKPPPPTWADCYALSRFSLSGPSVAGWFDGYNQDRPWPDRIRPGSFGLLAHPDPAFYEPGGEDNRPHKARQPAALPAAPYEPKPDKWPALDWYDRRTGNPCQVLDATQRHQPERFAHALTSGAVVIDTLAGVLGRYTRRPEHKSLAPDGTRRHRHHPRPTPAPTGHVQPRQNPPHRQRRQQADRTPHRRDHRPTPLPQRLRHPGRPMGRADPARAPRHGSREAHRAQHSCRHGLPRPQRPTTTQSHPRPNARRRGRVRHPPVRRVGRPDPRAAARQARRLPHPLRAAR
jgi:hypothetical protein